MGKKLIEVRDVELAVEDQGGGPPVLCVHGFPLNRQMWDAQVEAFSTTHRVIAPDLSGFGESASEADVLPMEQHADDLAALLDALQVDRPIVFCGLSMGGYIALQFWRKHRDRLKALVLCDTRAAADTPEARQARHEMAERVLTEGPDFVAEAILPKLLAVGTFATQADLAFAVREMILTTTPATIAAAQRGMAARPDASPWLSEIDVPTLVLVGEHDAISPPGEMREIADSIPGSRFVEIADAGHMTPMENPSAVNAAMREFLATV